MPISSRGFRNASKLNSLLEENGRFWQPADVTDGPDAFRAFLDSSLGGDGGPADPVVGNQTPAPGPAGGGEIERAPTGPGAVQVPSTLAPATPNAGVAIIGYNTGQNNESPAQAATLDKLHFVLLGPVGSGTQIFITDRAWNGTTFAAAGGDGTLTWTAGADLAAGTVVTATLSGGNVTFTVNGVTTAPVSAGGFDIDHTTGDAIYMYQGAINAPTSFLYAGEFADGNTTFSGSLVNTGLTAGLNAVAIAGDSGAYNGPTTHAENFLFNGAGSTILHAIADSTNWVIDDSTGDNAREQEVQNGPWFTHADVEFWGTMASGGLANTLRDSTHQSGNDDYNHTRQYDGFLFPVGHPQAGQNVFQSLRDMVFDTVDGKFFLVDSNIQGVNRILQGNIADLIANPTSVPTLTVLFSYTQAAGDPTDLSGRLDNMEVDLANNIVYFTKGNDLYKVNYDTANQAGTLLFQANVTNATSPSGVGNPAGSTNNFFNDMVIDFDSGQIYLSSTRVVASGGGDNITKNFIYQLTGLTAGSGTNAFTFDATNTGTARLLPFVQNDDAYNPNAGTTSSPSNAANAAFFFAQEYGTLDGFAIDPVNNILYFSTGEILFDHDGTSATAPIYQGGVIASYALTGNPTGIINVLHQQTAQFGGALPGLLGDLEVDLQNGHLYVLDYNGVNGNNEDNHWFRMNTNGTGIIQFTQTIGDPDGAATVGLTLNHAPTLTGSAAGGLAVTEASSAPNSGETARVTLFTGITIADVDTTTADEITGAVIRIGNGFTFEAASTAGGHTATVDFLRINGLTSGTIGGSGIAFTYNSSTGAMVLTGAATVAEYKAAIELVQFSTSGDNVTNNGNAATRTVFVSVSDGLTMSDEVSATVTVTGINDAPVNTVGAAMNFSEDTVGTAGIPAPPPAPVNAITGLAIADADADATTEVFTVTLSVANGILNIRTDVVGGLTAGDVTGNGTGSLVLTGTQTQINNALGAVNNVAAPNGLVYTPNANFNGADTLTMVTNDQGNNGNDPGSSGTGTTEQDSDTKTINVADVNDAPTVVDATQDSPTILEDIPFTNANAPTVASLFGTSFSDALDVQVSGGNPTGSPGDSFAGIAIVVDGSAPASGQWEYWNGAAWTDIGAASQAAARTFTAATQLRFNPALNFNGPAPTLTVHLIETGGPAIVNNGTVNLSPAGTATGGTTVYSAGTVVLSQAITPVNDAPTSANISGDSVTYTEQQALAALLDLGSNATVADVDSPNFDTGTLTVAITGGLVAAEDQLVIRLTGTVSFNGTAVFVNGTQIATYTGAGAGGGPLVFTFDADATPAAVAELIRAIAYQNSGGDNPTDGNRTITWTLVDGDGTANTGVDTLQFTSTVDVDPVNDAPQGTDATYAFNEDGSRILAAADFGYSDPADGDNFAGVVITTLPTNGVLLLNGVPVTVAGTFVTAAQIAGNQLVFQSDADENGTPYATFTFQVRDDGGVLDGGVDTDQSPNTITFDVTAVNDAPVIDNLGGDIATFTENGPPVLLDTGLAAMVSDVDNTNFNGGNIRVVIDAGWVPAEDVLGISTAGGVTLTDGTNVGSIVSVGGIVIGTITSGGPGSDDIDILFTTVDATPARVATLIQSFTYANTNTDDPSPAPRTIVFGVGDGAGNSDNESVTLNVVPVNDAPQGADNTVTASEDDPYVFTAANFGFSDPAEGHAFAGVVLTTLPVEGDLRLNGVNITVAGTFITAADIAAGLLTFLADPDEFGTAYATFTFQVRDDGGILNGGQNTDQSANTITIDVTADNAPPTLDLDGDDSNTVGTGYTAAFTEGGAAVLITDADVAIADADAGDMIEGATIAIQSPVAGDVLTLGAQGGFVVSGSGTSTITITGTGTAAQYEAMLELITFSNGTNDPGASRTIHTTVTDGSDNSNIAVTTINITQINQEPTLTATGGSPTLTEGGAAVDLFSAVTASTVEAGQSFTSLTLTVSGLRDGAAEVLFIDGSNVALIAGSTMTTSGGTATVTTMVFGPTYTATVVFTSAGLSAAAMGALIDGLTYINTSQDPFDGNRVITITQLVDSGPTGGANDNTATLSIAATVNVDPVNDAPVNTVPGTQTINEDASVTLSTANGNAIQVADADATTLTVTLTVVRGTLTLASTAGLSFGAGDGTADLTMTFSGTAAAINAALGSGLTYNPNANFNGSDSITVFTTDNGQSGGAAQTDSDPITVNITAINDAPVVIGDGTESATTINEDTPDGGQTIQALFAGQYSDAADAQFGVGNPGGSSPGQFSGIAVTANGSSAGTGQWQYFNGASWVSIGSASDSAAVLLGDPFVTLIRFQPATDFNGIAPTLTVRLIDNSLPFGIVNGQVVNLSGPGATGGTTAYSAGTVVLSQSVTAVNDGPLNTVPGAQTINEDASVTLSTGNGNAIQVADTDATTLTVTLTVANGTLTLASTAGLSFGAGDGTADLTMTFSGTAAAINAALGAGLTYNPTANYNGPDSIAVLTTDNGQTGTGGTLQDNDTIAITVNSVNDAPSGANATLTGSEDDPLVLTAADFGFTDPIDGNAFLAVIIDTFPANGTLFLDTDGPGGNPPVDLSTLGPGVFVSVTDINLGRLYFQPDTDEFGNNYAQFTFRVQDDGGMLNGGIDRDPTANTITINIAPDNLPPAVDLDGVAAGVNYATSFVEDGAAVAIGSGVTVTDPNSGTGDLIESATITLTDRVAGDSLTLTGALPPGFVAVTTPTAGAITIQITGAGTGAQYQALIESIVYSTTSQDPTVGGTDAARTITVTVNDGLIDSAVATTTVNITPVDDAPVAQPDAFTTDEGTVLTGNLFANNGSGADGDPDSPLVIGAVNGSSANVGVQIALASGALLTVNANGTFSYDPNGVFDPTPTPGSGASNQPVFDGFDYTLQGGNTAAVTLTINGLDSDDLLLGTAGSDYLIAGNGTDTLVGGVGNDQLDGGAGIDTATFAGVLTSFTDSAIGWVVTSAEGNDVLQNVEIAVEGSGQRNLLVGATGFAGVQMALNAANNTDNVRLAAGSYAGVFSYADAGLTVIAQPGAVINASFVTAGAWGIAVRAAGGVDSISGSANGDLLDGGAGADVLTGGGGNDFLVGGTGADAMAGGTGDDTFYVDDANDIATEAVGEGNDRIAASVSYTLNGSSEVEVLESTNLTSTNALDLFGNDLANIITGNNGVNILKGEAGTDTLSGAGGDDFLVGGTGADIMSGDGGNDTFYVDDAGDVAYEAVGQGNDRVAVSVSYVLTDGQEIERLEAVNLTDTNAIDLTGNGLANALLGNNGANILDGKGGNDVLEGLGGADVFAFSTAVGAGNVDTILDFGIGADKIALDNGVFDGIGAPGSFNVDAFRVGAAALDADDRILYNNGQLFYDADGNGAGAAVLFATLNGSPALTAADFQVI